MKFQIPLLICLFIFFNCKNSEKTSKTKSVDPIQVLINKNADSLLLDSKINAVLTLGKETVATDGALSIDFHRHFNHKDDLLKTLIKIINDEDKVLVKGSRGMKMETIVEVLLK